MLQENKSEWMSVIEVYNFLSDRNRIRQGNERDLVGAPFELLIQPSVTREEIRRRATKNIRSSLHENFSRKSRDTFTLGGFLYEQATIVGVRKYRAQELRSVN